MIIGGSLLSLAHVLAGLMLNSTRTADSFTTAGLFIIGILGGQGASIIFISTLSFMLRYHSIVCSHLVYILLVNLCSDKWSHVFIFLR